ncbi:unnamed protein product [Rotaria magnacalcarata]|uniref:Beta-lactamase-related domain-containing protein n=1 Tax=Rotaria magnacalcarata TaxID=392030 RepID=A0A817A3U9_9BILA|nr:unnamed protein product [Rotaria magnacalcarata]CAF4110655.1 unnamed protein product [Rotaria magnacalcarata]
MLVLIFLFVAFAQGSQDVVQCSLSRASIENSLYAANINGLAAIVINSTHFLYEQTFGYNAPRIINTRRLIDSCKTIFVLASISKTFIAVAVMQLVEFNKLDLDKDVNQYLPSHLKVVHPLHPTIPITMRHILAHTSGIGPNFDEEMKHYLPSDDFTKKNLSDTILLYINNKSNWLSKPPGTTLHYSNTGASLAALVIEQIAEIPFERYVREKILQPLGISKQDAGYRLSDFENRKQDLMEHYIFNSSWLEQAQNWLPQLNITRVDNTSEWLYIPHFSVADYPAGLLRMSAHSLAIYFQSFLNNFPSVLLNSSSVSEMIRVNPNEKEEVQFGLLWYWLNFHERRLIGHQGAMPGIINIMVANANRTLGVVILSNGDVTKSDESAKNVEATIMSLMIKLFDCFE